MVISHYVVSWIQIGGLLCTLIGLFYLSLSVFDRRGMQFVRPLFPSAAIALIVITIFTALLPISGPQLATSRVELVAAAGVFAIAYAETLFVPAFQRWTLSVLDKKIAKLSAVEPRVMGEWLARLYGLSRSFLKRGIYVEYVLIDLVGGVVVGVLAAQHHALFHMPGYFAGPLLGGGSIIYGGTILFVLNVLPEWLKTHESALPLVGFLLSAAGVLTSFLLPVLDVLAIQVR